MVIARLLARGAAVRTATLRRARSARPLAIKAAAARRTAAGIGRRRVRIATGL